MNIKACIFDLDGVIVDTAKYHYLAWKRLCNELGFDFTEKQNERLKGVSRMDSLEILLELGKVKLSNNDKEKYAALKNDWYKEMVDKMSADEILPGVIDFLTEIRNERILIALGSASKNAVSILNKLNIANFFDVIIDGTKTTKAKPDPQVFLMGAEALGVNASECVVFEDAIAGVEAAKAGGMLCVGIGEPDILNRADIVIAGLHQMKYGRLKELSNKK